MSDDEDTQLFAGVRGCVLLIDVSPSMWVENEESKPIDLALESCLSLLRKMIIEAPKQLVGVSLYATEKNDDQGIANVKQIVQLGEPTVEALIKLKELASNPKDIISKWGSTDDYNLADALWQGSKMFSGCKKVMNSQSVILLSVMGEPDVNTHRVVLKKVNDLKELNIDINFINLSSRDLSPASFFVELGKVLTNTPNPEWELPEPVTCLEDIVPLLWSNHHRASAFASIHFMLSPDVYMGTKLYYLQKKKDKPRKVQLNRETNELVKSYNVTHARTEDDAEDGQSQESLGESSVSTNLSNITPVNKSDITHTTSFGGRLICLSDSEMFMLKTFAGNPCIKLLGFHSASELNMPELYLKNSAFLYPNESQVEGSTTMFLALRDCCLAQGRIPICLLTPRRRSHATPVALIPQKRVMNGGRQVYPDGFHVVYLPYADNLKDIPYSNPIDLTYEQKYCMENIVSKLKIPYDDNTFENPVLQKFYKALEALALEEDLQDVEDTTMPDVNVQDGRLGDLIDKFAEVFSSMNPPAVKRSQNSEKPNKRHAAGDAGMDKTSIIDGLNNNKVNKFTVAELKQIIKYDNISKIPALSGLKKDDLVKLVNENKDNILSCVINS